MKHKALKIAIAAVVAFVIGFLSSIRPAPAQQRFDPKPAGFVLTERR